MCASFGVQNSLAWTTIQGRQCKGYNLLQREFYNSHFSGVSLQAEKGAKMISMLCFGKESQHCGIQSHFFRSKVGGINYLTGHNADRNKINKPIEDEQKRNNNDNIDNTNKTYGHIFLLIQTANNHGNMHVLTLQASFG